VKAMEVCNICGLPKELCICGEIARESQKIKIYVTKRKFGKPVTIVEGMDEKAIDLDKLVKELKSQLACGGTVKDGKIELQGNHKSKIKKILIKQGFIEDLIEVVE